MPLRNFKRIFSDARIFADYFIAPFSRRFEKIDTIDSLICFVETRASHVAQTSLYGYIRTRAGTRYPELFADEQFITSINISKWEVWIASVSDLIVYTGGLLIKGENGEESRVFPVISKIEKSIFERVGKPLDAGDDFCSNILRQKARIADTDWDSVLDGGTSFSESPEALVVWAPIADNLKELDSEIIRNSVRFRWHEVKRELRKRLDCQSVLRSVNTLQNDV